MALKMKHPGEIPTRHLHDDLSSSDGSARAIYGPTADTMTAAASA
jgi:hypothetical protein